VRVPERTPQEAATLFSSFEALLRQINLLRKVGLIRIDSDVADSPAQDLILSKNEIGRLYETSMQWPRRFFNFNPRFTYGHFQEFFELACK
jgi:hypothetical protein